MVELKNPELAEVVGRGPHWLFVRLRPEREQMHEVADHLWRLLEQQFTYRVVLEMDEVTFLPSILMGQLVMLHKRVLQHNGALRICGLSPQCAQALHFCRLDQALPHFATREEAIKAEGHGRPR
jgi:anti-anti-sigma factor